MGRARHPGPGLAGRGFLSRLLLGGILAVSSVGCDRPATPTSTSLAIEGMHCEDCAESIHHAVTGLPGIEACQVSYADGEAEIRGDSPAALEAAIDRIRLLGFTVDPVNPS